MNKIAIASMSLTAAFAFSLAACAEMHYTQPISEPAASQSAAEVQIPNPWQDASSMQDAQNLAGFTLTGPEMLHEMKSELAREAAQLLAQELRRAALTR